MIDHRLIALAIYLAFVVGFLRWFWCASPRRDALNDPQDDLPKRAERLLDREMTVEDLERLYGGDHVSVHFGDRIG